MSDDTKADPTSDTDVRERTYALTKAIFDAIDAHMETVPNASVPDVLAAMSVAVGTVLAQLQIEPTGHFHIVNYSAHEAYKALAAGVPNEYPKGWARPRSLDGHFKKPEVTSDEPSAGDKLAN